MQCTVEDLYMALGNDMITVEQLLEVLTDNMGRRKALRMIKRDIKKYQKVKNE